MITIDRGNGIEEFDETKLQRLDGSFENENEKTTWIEYWMNGISFPVHRSVHVHLKQGAVIPGLTGKLS